MNIFKLCAKSSLTPRQPLICFISLQICVFWTFHINGIMQYEIFCICLLSFSIMFLRFLHAVACISGIPLSLYIQQWMDIWIVCSLGRLWIMLLWPLPCKSLCWCFHFFVVLRHGIAVLYGIFLFNYLIHSQTLFCNGCIIFLSHQQCMRVPISWHPCLSFLLWPF